MVMTHNNRLLISCIGNGPCSYISKRGHFVPFELRMLQVGCALAERRVEGYSLRSEEMGFPILKKLLPQIFLLFKDAGD